MAYRETGTGPALVLLHSLGLSHREWEPIVEPLAQRFRVVLPDLPMHGDSEDRPRHPYSRDWFIDVLSGFCIEVGGPRLCLAGHDLGAELALTTVASGRLAPRKLVLMSHRLDGSSPFPARRALWRAGASLGAMPGIDLAVSHLAPLVFRPALGERLSHQANPAARDLLRHALADVPGNANRARAWAKFARRWPAEPRPELVARLGALELPVLLLWAEEDPAAPLAWAEAALGRLPDGQLRTVPAAGFLMAYDDPVVLARELIAFLG